LVPETPVTPEVTKLEKRRLNTVFARFCQGVC
jgi:hypothetical protein